MKPGKPEFFSAKADAAAGSAPVGARAARPLSVSEITFRLKDMIEREFRDVCVEGEISNFRPAASGHYYFVLKDERATISCVLWSRDAAAVTTMPREGDTVEIRGSVSLYEPRGQYQIVVRSIRPAGVGKLFAAFQEMKEKLQAEGLFDPAHQKPIPRFPRVVGVVTSPTGAAIRDVLNVLSRRAPHLRVVIWPVRVQGEGAAAEIAHAVSRMDQLKLADLLIVGRGGGSIEDLWSFNEEIVARAIFNCATPVISAVGHETDFTIADFVADHRAPTPSAAAELAAADSAETLRHLANLGSRIHGAMRRTVEPLRRLPHLHKRLEQVLLPRIQLLRSMVAGFEQCRALDTPTRKVNDMKQRLDDMTPRLAQSLDARRTRLAMRLDRLNAQLRALDPTGILARGYAIAFDAADGSVVRSCSQAHPGQALRIALADGQVDAHVDGAPPAPRPGRRAKSARPDDTGFFGMPDPEDAAPGSGGTQGMTSTPPGENLDGLHRTKDAGGVRTMFDHIAPTYDLLNHVLSLGTDLHWRRRAARDLVRPGAARALDVCCGTGDMALALLRRARAASAHLDVTATDFSPAMTRLGNSKASAWPAGQVRFAVADTLSLPFPDGTFDLVTAAFGIRNVENLEQGLGEMARVCRAGGRVAILEFSHPRNPLFRRIYEFYFFRVLPLIGRTVSGSAAYGYLPQSVAAFPDHDTMKRLMAGIAGGPCTGTRLTLGIASLYVAQVAKLPAPTSRSSIS